MQQPKDFHQFGNKLIDIQSIQTVTRLSHESYQLGMDNGEQVEIGGEERCNKLIEILASRLGAKFTE